ELRAALLRELTQRLHDLRTIGDVREVRLLRDVVEASVRGPVLEDYALCPRGQSEPVSNTLPVADLVELGELLTTARGRCSQPRLYAREDPSNRPLDRQRAILLGEASKLDPERNRSLPAVALAGWLREYPFGHEILPREVVKQAPCLVCDALLLF